MEFDFLEPPARPAQPDRHRLSLRRCRRGRHRRPRADLLCQCRGGEAGWRRSRRAHRSGLRVALSVAQCGRWQAGAAAGTAVRVRRQRAGAACRAARCRRQRTRAGHQLRL
ncbi:MAG: hypothetical protein M5R42_20815 [Rhodocyclaceae bacterium]|nr:hypothetical protein [Rhodocyclaceae bacterium]